MIAVVNPRVPTLARTTAAVGVLLLASACSDSDGGSDDAAPPAAESTSAGSSPTPSSDPAADVDCAATAVSATFADGEVDLTTSAAVELGDGSAYTVYAGDFTIPTDDISVAGARAADGEHLATLAITTFNAEESAPEIEVGQVVPYTTDFGVLTFAVLLQSGTDILGNNVGGAGEAVVAQLSDDEICVSVDYSDDEKSLTGVIVAPVFE